MLPIQDIAGRTGDLGQPIVIIKTTKVGPLSFNFAKTGTPLNWDMGDGTVYTGTNFVLHNYVSIGEKTITVYGDDPSLLTGMGSNNNREITYVDLSNTTNLSGGLDFSDNPLATFIQPTSTGLVALRLNNTDLSGVLDITNIILNQLFYAHFTNITSILHNTSAQNLNDYRAYSANLTGIHKMEGIILKTVFSGNAWFLNNPLLTNVIFNPDNTQTIRSIALQDCNLTGVLDLTMITITEFYQLHNNINLTSILHKTGSAVNMNRYFAYNTGIINLDLTMISNFGGNIRIYDCPDLINIDFPNTSVLPGSLWFQRNASMVQLDLTPFVNINGGLLTYSSASLNSVLFNPVIGTGELNVIGYDCDEMVTWDFSSLNLTGYIQIGNLSPGGIPNPNKLENVIFNPNPGNSPNVTGFNFQYSTKLQGLDLTTLNLDNVTRLQVLNNENFTFLNLPNSTAALDTFNVYFTATNGVGNGVGIIDIFNFLI